MKKKTSTIVGMAALVLVPLAMSNNVCVAAEPDVIAAHPNGKQFAQIFTAPVPPDFKNTGIARADYLKLIAGNVDFFKKYQNEAGAIIDPVSKGERQYSTPAFAAAAGLLVKEAGRTDLLEPACRAMTCALTALVEKRAADKHADFYIPMLVHAYRFLKDVAPADESATWVKLFKQIDPETMYRADLRGMNWNIVSSSGELLRRKEGLVADTMRAAQMTYLEKCLAGHMKTLTPLGLFEDPGAPMAYDAFSRLWLDDVFADDAYDGANSEKIRTFLKTGGLSTLLLLSPTGEWPTGGRSALHNWTDAEAGAICEIHAAQWKKAGRDDVAGAFKRAAHLAFQSVARWQRPSGELWIIKNRAEPETRLAYEGYSNHSQYNLLPMAMLAIAYSRADESIVEKPTPSEVGGYVFDARETFHKVAAASGGYYALIDTAGDPHYNATGLQRVHRSGVLFPAFNDSAAGERAYGAKQSPNIALAPGLQWKSGADWMSLANFSGEKAKVAVNATTLKVTSSDDKSLSFDLTYTLKNGDQTSPNVTERYTLSSAGVELTTSASGATGAFRVHVPVLVNDGAKDMSVQLTSNSVKTDYEGSTTTIEFPADALVDALKLDGPRIVTHSGFVQEAAAGVKTNSITIKFTLSQK